jgi:hypothetical protein
MGSSNKLLLIIIFCMLQISSHELISQSQQISMKLVSSKAYIVGTTNVNRFHCDLETSINSQLEVMTTSNGDTLNFDGLTLVFPIAQFDCGMVLMTQDFRSFLQADQFPELIIDIQHMVINRSESLMEKVSIVADVSIQLSGQLKSHQIRRGYVMEMPDDEIRFVGEDYVRFTDFGLIPPTKFFGTVRVQDELEIAFDVVLGLE